MTPSGNNAHQTVGLKLDSLFERYFLLAVAGAAIVCGMLKSSESVISTAAD